MVQIYYWSIISNMVLRGAWTYKLSAELRKNYKIVFLFSFLEMMRRFQWIFFRVEIAVLKISSSSTPSSLTQVSSISLQGIIPSARCHILPRRRHDVDFVSEASKHLSNLSWKSTITRPPNFSSSATRRIPGMPEHQFSQTDFISISGA